MIEWIVTSSALIVLVALLRIIIKDRVSPRLRYALWGLVLLRLLIPGTLWESRASVMTPVAAREEYQAAERIPGDIQTQPDGWVETGHPSSGNRTPVPPEAEAVRTDRPTPYEWFDSEEAVNLTELREQVSIRDAFLLVWLAGSAVVSTFLLAVNLKFSRNLKKNRRTLEQYRARPVFTAEGLPTPCLFGLFRPAIYLTPEVAADDAAKAHVLAHEYAHFRQGDHIWAFLRGVCLALHWYNPLVWLAAYLSRRDCELSCDEGAVRLLGEEHRADYGRTLVGLVARRTTPKDLACCATTMTGGRSALKERVALLVKHPRTTVRMACAVAAACMVFAVCTFTGAAAENTEDAEDTEPDVSVEPPQMEAQEPEKEEENPPVSFRALPEDLPTELMDLTRPAEEQGPWLLLAETPGFDIALYRSAWDDRHVYLRVTNQSFQRFDRDLSGMELLPTLELVEGDADLTVWALYRRYEGTCFNGTSYEPGVVADQAIYLWSATEKYWTEARIGTQPARLTEDLPAIADLPGIFGIHDFEAPMWWVGTVREEGISLYWAQYEDQMYLRYGNHIQRIEDKLECEWLPELYFEDLDGDGDRELLIHYHTSHGTGVHTDAIAVHEWDGESWHGTRHTPDSDIEGFNNDLDRIFEFYEDGTAFIKYGGSSVLLDLSDRWESGYWESAPKTCALNQFWTHYTYEDGQITLTIGGVLLGTGSPSLQYAFDYVRLIPYTQYEDGGRLGYWSDVVLRSDYAAEPELPALTDAWRAVLEKTWAQCDKGSANYFAVHDVNGDGKDELIVTWMPEGAISSAWGTSVYNANGAERFHGCGELTFYSNGAISEPWSHNQGPASAMWPYDLYVCSAYAYNGYHTFLYSKAGSARARSDYAPGFEDVAYADLDGDGVVYYIGEDAYKEENPVDNDVYEAWRDQFLAGAQVLPVQYFPLTEGAVSSLQ